MTTLTLIYLILASPVRDGSAWSITPMPSMAVCQQVIADIRKNKNSWSDDFPRAPAGSYCLEVK